MKIAKRCPICGGEPQYVHYCIPGAMDDPDEKYILLKRLECKECGASVTGLVMTCDEAVDWWNEEKDGHRIVLQRIGTEPCKCEPKSDAKEE